MVSVCMVLRYAGSEQRFRRVRLVGFAVGICKRNQAPVISQVVADHPSLPVASEERNLRVERQCLVLSLTAWTCSTQNASNLRVERFLHRHVVSSAQELTYLFIYKLYSK